MDHWGFVVLQAKNLSASVFENGQQLTIAKRTNNRYVPKLTLIPNSHKI